MEEYIHLYKVKELEAELGYEKIMMGLNSENIPWTTLKLMFGLEKLKQEFSFENLLKAGCNNYYNSCIRRKTS